MDGTRFDDSLVGTGDSDTIYGFAGNDTIQGLDGTDLLYGGTGNDSLMGGGGNDLYFVDSTFDVVSEWGYIPFLDVMGDKGGLDTVYATCSLYVLPTASTGVAPVGTPGFGRIEDLIFQGGGDFTGYGNDIGNIIAGGAGLDLLKGFGGNDYLVGKGGFDELYGGDGNDALDGSTGTDVAYGGAGDDTFYVQMGRDIVSEWELGPFGSGFDAGGIDTVIAACNRYTLPKVLLAPSPTGGQPRGRIENLTYDPEGTQGFSGKGNAADNVITAGDHSDTLDGMGGRDTLIGGYDLDLMTGGGGADVFVIRDSWEFFDEFGPNSGGYDEITDFKPGTDKIDLSAVIDGSLTFIESGAAFTASDQVRVVVYAGFSVVELRVDINGGPMSFEAIFLQGDMTVTAGDFIL